MLTAWRSAQGGEAVVEMDWRSRLCTAKAAEWALVGCPDSCIAHVDAALNLHSIYLSVMQGKREKDQERARPDKLCTRAQHGAAAVAAEGRNITARLCVIA